MIIDFELNALRTAVPYENSTTKLGSPDPRPVHPANSVCESRTASLRGILLEWNHQEAEWVSQTQRSVTGTRVQSTPFYPSKTLKHYE